MSALIQVKKIARDMRRALGFSPMQVVLRRLMANGTNISELHALEVFGCDGDSHTVDYASRVASLEVWDISPDREADLRRNLPMATVKICDSYKEIRVTSSKYGLIVIDNSPCYQSYVEHFELFPHVLKVANRELVMIVNIIPEISEAVARMYPRMLEPEVTEARKSFYGVEDPRLITLEHIIAKYLEVFRHNGFICEGYFTERRNRMLRYLVLKAVRES